MQRTRVAPQFLERHSVRATCAARRQGAIVVELALVSAFLAVLMLGICEVGQALRAESLLTQAARHGCASASQPGCSSARVTQTVRSALSAEGLPGNEATVTILVNDQPANASTAGRNDKLTVTVTMPSAKATWMGSNLFVGANSIRSEAITVLRQN